MRKIIVLPFLLASLMVLTAGCGIKNDLDILGDVPYGKDDYKKITSANNELGFKLLKEVQMDMHGNTFISPISLLMALSMVYNGADGKTKKEIANTLQAEDIDVKALNKANASLMSMLHNDSEQVQLNVANSIWLNEDYHFQDDFTQANKAYFNAEIQEIDINSGNSPKKINEWVEKATNAKIKEIVEAPLDSDLVTMLINAIYFKGNWTYEFAEKQTASRTFHLADGTTKEVPLMRLQEDLAYMENEDFQAVTLPYGDDEEMSMSVFLPRENTNIEDFRKMLTYENWQEWNLELRKQKGIILLPKFQLEYETSLNETLKKLGMTTAFNEKANFSLMVEEDVPLWISQVKQKTFIDVNEEGTEAAAATSVQIVTESATMDRPFHMEVIRPFVITITEDETDTILFLGVISNPQEGE